ncbi:hypothetical protein D3Z53_25985 [Lachnospiraceae bacterium]|jgi:hypothetical protein|nr:hypothetical protein [uncultured Schaedlerella sp.]NBI61343.1 hypothetical protein [Lachnospiraceae bacterium]
MVKINENEAIVSKKDLAVLIGAVMALTIDSYDLTSKQESLIMKYTVETILKTEGHIWGDEKIPEETLDLTKDIAWIYERLDPVYGPDQAEEDKQAICKLLLTALQKTKAYHDLTDLEYGPSAVIAKYASGGTRRINTEGDSGIALINDILAHI